MQNSFWQNRKQQYFFRSNAFCDTVHCVVKVNLFYSKKNDPKKYSWSLLSVECKDMRFRKDDKLIVIQDKFKQHINDSIIKYIKQYYSSKHRLLTEFELVTISKYSSYKGVLKLVTTFSKVYIIPYKRELDLWSKFPNLSNWYQTRKRKNCIMTPTSLPLIHALFDNYKKTNNNLWKNFFLLH